MPRTWKSSSAQPRRRRIKVAGRVVASDKRQGVAIIAVDPTVVASVPVMRPDCNAAPVAVEYQQKVVTIVAPLLEPKSAVLGTIGRVKTLVFNVDWRLTGGIAGGPYSMRVAGRLALPSPASSARISLAAIQKPFR